MTLTEFLLARIAEDEATASRYHRLLCLRTACDAECCWGDGTDEQIAAERVCTCGYPSRLAAECEAKRRIVELHDVAHYCTDGTLQPPIAPPAFAGADGRWRLCPTVGALAAAYVDHPDYREEWRP